MLVEVSNSILVCCAWLGPYTVADLGGVRGVQMHPPLAASNVFLHK